MVKSMENSRILVDTNILIDHFRKKRKNTTLLYRLNEQYRLAISTITEFEFLSGFSKAQEALGRAIVREMDVLSFNTDCARQAVIIYRTLKIQNALVPPMDIFIAATAIVHKFPLATFNPKHFKRIKDLVLLPG
jgi:tRNA(fMet)-specific endonuclease VapC